MQNTTELRRRINAVEQTKKLTGAMQLVSYARMRSVLQHLDYNRKYFESIRSTMRDILHSSEDVFHPYLRNSGGKRNTYIVIAGDKGMAGSYNISLLRFAMSEIEKHPDSTIITIGSIAKNYFASKGIKVHHMLPGLSKIPRLSYARHLEEMLQDLFDSEKTDTVNIIYTSFYGNNRNKPVLSKLLPISNEDFNDIKTPSANLDGIIFHPSSQQIFDTIVPEYLIGLIHGILVQTLASENFMRTNAMQSSTKNAEELLKKLKLQYNMARQAAITQEISEITGAAEILLKEDSHHESE